MKIKSFLSIVLITAVIAFTGMVTATASAHNVPFPVCGNGEHVGNPHCITPTPTVAPTATPTPTEAPCFVWEKEFPVPCPTETPTASPTPTVQPETVSNSGGGSPEYKPVSCTDTSVTAPLLQGFKAEGNGQVTFSYWGVDGADHYSIRYGYTPDQLIYGIPYIPASSTSITIGGLEQGRNVWAIVTVYKHDCAVDSNILDPIVR